jgi:glycosyltransferase involved in cell wall biosynthesis
MIDSSTPSVSVVIPTYNGQRYLGAVLGALALQTLAPAQFEVVVVDNNSTVDLFAGRDVQVALRALKEHGVSLRCVRERQQGLTFARAAGVAAARAQIVCFLDDDNEPDAGYLAAGAHALADQSAGLLISRVYPVYEVPPSPAVLRREHLLAINYRLGDSPIRWPASCVICPALGAGLWIRKALFQEIQARFGAALLPDRVGTNLVSGGDIELGIGVGMLGFDRIYVPELVLKHHIPGWRVQAAYVSRLIVGIVRSEAALDAMYVARSLGVIRRIGQFLGRAAAGGVVALCRGDVCREYRFILAAAYGRLRGPIVPIDRSRQLSDAREHRAPGFAPADG